MKIIIEKPLITLGWEARTLSQKGFEKIEKCPCCEHDLSTLAKVSGPGKVIRIGICPICGHVTYIDRLTEKEIISFYSHSWDKAGMTRGPKPLREQEDGFASIIESLGVKKESLICDIGSGYGRTLAYLKRLGFSNLIGIENSIHRADSSERTWEIPILKGHFESKNVQDCLEKKKPVKIFIATHVLEHVYDPARFLKSAWELQNDGDYFIIRVPNMAGEPIINILLFAPHMHSFTESSLQSLLNNCGYNIVDRSNTTQNEIFYIARKENENRTKNPIPANEARIAYAKIENELKPIKKYSRSIFWWEKKGLKTGALPLTRIKVLNRFITLFAKLLL